MEPSYMSFEELIRASDERRHPTPGQFIYLLTSPWVPEGIYKIGRTGHPDRRLLEHRCALPKARYARLIQIDNAVEAESMLHRCFKAKKFDGEWYRVTLEDFDEACASMFEPEE